MCSFYQQPYWFLVDHDKEKVLKFVGQDYYDLQYPIKSGN